MQSLVWKGGITLASVATLVYGMLGGGVGGRGIAVELLVDGLTQPVLATAAPADPRLFVVQRGGTIRIVEDESLLTTPFLDISARVGDTSSEKGLLGLAFPDDHATSGLFYVYYTHTSTDGTVVESRLSRFAVSGDPDVADSGSEEILLTIPQPANNHNGGHIAFGPDGMLFVGTGDGGGAGDPDENAQDLGTLLGKILRVDVSGGSGSGYSVPPDNPFVGQAGLDEIWAYGLRNPYRWSFDRETGDQYIGDVGQQTWEEVDVEPAGSGGGTNYGWDVMEGPACFEPASGCDTTGLTLPVHAYEHDAGRCSITGGVVYRGQIESIQGLYFFADFCTGEVFSFRWDGGGGIRALRNRTEELRPPGGSLGNIVAIGEDASGEIYIVSIGGEIYRVIQAPFRIFRAD